MTIAKLVTQVLVPMGIRMVCTSRPDGVDLVQFQDTFVIMRLEELSDEQAKHAIEQQMSMFPEGQEFSRHLLAFSEIRSGHERIWREVAFPKDEMRRQMEELAAPDGELPIRRMLCIATD